MTAVIEQPLVLDGGMGHLLRRKGIEIAGPLGSLQRFLGVAMANRDAPELVIDAHREFLSASVDVITTNTYACVPAAIGSDDDLVLDLIRRGGRLAQVARDRHIDDAPSSGHRPLIAGCLPPLHESYRPDLIGDERELATVYHQIVESITPYSDVLLCETMSSAAEARAAAQAASETGKPVWVSWTLDDDASGRLRSGESLDEAVDALTSIPNVQLYSVNCSSPDAIDAGVVALGRIAGTAVLIGAYANGFSAAFRTSNVGTEYDDGLSPPNYADRVDAWIGAGASVVGGCCGVFPEHIASFANRL